MTEYDGSAVFRMKISIEYLIGVFGTSLALSVALSLLIIFPKVVFSFEGEVASAVIAAISMIAGYLVASLLQEKIAPATYPPLIICAAAGSISLCLLTAGSMGFPSAALIGLLILSSIGSSMLISNWFCWVCAQDSPRELIAVAAASALACITCSVESLLDLGGGVLACVLFIGSSWIAFYMRQKGSTLNCFPYISNSESDSRSKITIESTIKLSMDSFQFGLIISIALLSSSELACLVAGFAASVVVLIDRVSVKKVSERALSMFASPLMSASLCGLFLFDWPIQLVACCVIAGLFAMATCVGWSAMAGHVRMSRLSPLRVFAKARRVQCLAMTAGIAFGWMVFLLAGDSWLLSARITVCLSMVFVFVFSVLHKSRFPEIGLEDDGQVNAGNKGMWSKRCRALSNECGLSDRQAEVLFLIAQGRSAKYVENELSISLSTAQTHIRNIYRKVGVHSRQELLDRIEATKLYGED